MVPIQHLTLRPVMAGSAPMQESEYTTVVRYVAF